MYTRIVIYTFLTLIFSLSCGIQKRKYFSGYYISKSSKKTGSSEKNDTKNQKRIHTLCNAGKEDDITYFTASNQNVITQEIKEDKIVLIKKKILLPKDSCQDELIFKSGERIKVRILEISTHLVRFQNCDLPDGMISEVSKNELSVILPQKGKAILLDKEPEKNKSVNSQSGSVSNETKPRIHPEILIGLLLMVLYFFPFILFTTLRYKAVRKEIINNPDKYKGLILWDIMFGISLAFILLLMLFFFAVINFFAI
jgi:hypothetical protein